jgi:hypothetical protein
VPPRGGDMGVADQPQRGALDRQAGRRVRRSHVLVHGVARAAVPALHIAAARRGLARTHPLHIGAAQPLARELDGPRRARPRLAEPRGLRRSRGAVVMHASAAPITASSASACPCASPNTATTTTRTLNRHARGPAASERSVLTSSADPSGRRSTRWRRFSLRVVMALGPVPLVATGRVCRAVPRHAMGVVGGWSRADQRGATCSSGSTTSCGGRWPGVRMQQSFGASAVARSRG